MVFSVGWAMSGIFGVLMVVIERIHRDDTPVHIDTIKEFMT